MSGTLHEIQTVVSAEDLILSDLTQYLHVIEGPNTAECSIGEPSHRPEGISMDDDGAKCQTCSSVHSQRKRKFQRQRSTGCAAAVIERSRQGGHGYLDSASSQLKRHHRGQCPIAPWEATLFQCQLFVAAPRAAPSRAPVRPLRMLRKLHHPAQGAGIQAGMVA